MIKTSGILIKVYKILILAIHYDYLHSCVIMFENMFCSDVSLRKNKTQLLKAERI